MTENEIIALAHELGVAVHNEILPRGATQTAIISTCLGFSDLSPKWRVDMVCRAIGGFEDGLHSGKSLLVA